MRTGWDETPKLAHTMAGYIQHWANLSESTVLRPSQRAPRLSVHGRSSHSALHEGRELVHINMVAKCQDESIPAFPIVGNGDVFSRRDYAERELAPATCDCAMLARGALIKPWLPTEFKEKRDWDISSSERLDILRDFCKYGLDHWGSDSRASRGRGGFVGVARFLHRHTPSVCWRCCRSASKNGRLLLLDANDLETLMASDDSRDWVKISITWGQGRRRVRLCAAPVKRARVVRSSGGEHWGKWRPSSTHPQVARRNVWGGCCFTRVIGARDCPGFRRFYCLLRHLQPLAL